MDKLICQRCKSEISNDFNVTLVYCTNCGVSIANLINKKTELLEPLPTISSFSPSTKHSPNDSKTEGYPTHILPNNSIQPYLMENPPPVSKTKQYLVSFLIISVVLIGTFRAIYQKDVLSLNFAKKDSKTLYALVNEHHKLDPHLDFNPIIINALFDGLVEFDETNSSLVPSLASRWERNADATVWTFYLRKDPQWTDGKPITAKDFVYSWKRALDPKNKTNWQIEFLYYIKNAESYNTRKMSADDVGIKAIDDYTLQVTMESPTPFFDKLIPSDIFRPVPKTAIEKYGENWTDPSCIITSGAYTLAFYDLQDQIILLRDPYFWNAAKTKIEKLVFVTNEKNASKVSAPINWAELYDKDEINLVFAPSKISDSFKTKEIQTPVNEQGVLFLNINTTIEPFNDIRVRRALSMAINREDNDLILSPTYSFTTKLKNYKNAASETFNPDKARKLLAEAGFPNGKNFPPMEIIYNVTNDIAFASAVFTLGQWQKELGIKVSTKGLTFKDILEARKQMNYQGAIISIAYSDFPDPYSLLKLFEGEKNNFGWIDKRYTKMLQQANSEVVETNRYKILHEAEKYLLEQQPLIPLQTLNQKILYKSYVKNLTLNVFNQVNWREISIERK